MLPLNIRVRKCASFEEDRRADNVKAVVVGGDAVPFYGRPRFTKDIDVLIDASPGNVTRLAVVSATSFSGDVVMIKK